MNTNDEMKAELRRIALELMKAASNPMKHSSRIKLASSELKYVVRDIVEIEEAITDEEFKK